jgi:hypothetical protein
MINYDRLAEYRPGVRPVGAESLPAHIDRELARLRDIIIEQNEVHRDLNARLKALEP